jgi:uncharacterized membrane protein
MSDGVIWAGLLINAAIAVAAVVTALATLNYAKKTKELVEATRKMVDDQARAAKLNLEISVQMKMEEQWDGARVKAARRRLATMFATRGFQKQAGKPLPPIRDVLALPTSPPDDDVFEFFESLGFYIKRHFDDVEMAWNTFGHHCLCWWALSERYIRKMREEWGEPLMFAEFEGLARRFANVEASRRGVAPLSADKDERLEKFVEDEQTLKVGNS